MKKTFKYGVHPKHNKSTKDLPIEIMDVPEEICIPLGQHIGAPAEAVVEKGDKVKVGDLIGKAKNFISANVHSSVSGEVTGVKFVENTFGIKVKHITIKNDFLYQTNFLTPLPDPTKEEIVERVKSAGIVGLGGATFPTSVKLMPQDNIHTLIINGAECEPYITCDHRLMLEYSKELIEGVILVKKAIGAEKVYIGIEDNKQDAIKALQEVAKDNIEIVELKTKYPQGGEKQLIYAITRGVVPDGALPSAIGTVVVSVATSFAVYEACKLGKPLFGRFMTVAGNGVINKKNLYVRCGISYSFIIDKLGSNNDYVKAISGGPMMGIAISNLNMCTAKGSSALLLLTEDEIRGTDPSVCINCARCQKACPMNLMPMFIDAYALTSDWELAKKYGANSCIECGCCTYVCPAKRPLVQSIKLAKKYIREKKI